MPQPQTATLLMKQAASWWGLSHEETDGHTPITLVKKS